MIGSTIPCEILNVTVLAATSTFTGAHMSAIGLQDAPLRVPFPVQRDDRAHILFLSAPTEFNPFRVVHSRSRECRKVDPASR